MKNLIIIGARNLGRETFSLAKTCAEHSRDFKIKGFLDDKNSGVYSKLVEIKKKKRPLK